MEKSELRQLLIEAAEIAHRARSGESQQAYNEREGCVLLEIAERAGLCPTDLTTLIWSKKGMELVKKESTMSEEERSANYSAARREVFQAYAPAQRARRTVL